MSADTRNDPRQSPAPTPGSFPTGSVGAGAKRQQRVGILRNPNRAPAPPPRRAPLTGKWFSLRSSRRAEPALVDTAAQAVIAETRLSIAEPESAASSPMIKAAKPARARQADKDRAAEGGRPARARNKTDAPGNTSPGKSSLRIDIARLTESVADLGDKKSRRRRYGETVSPRNAPPGSGDGAKAPIQPDGDSADEDAKNPNATARRVDGRASNVLPALGDGEDEITSDAPEKPAVAGKSSGGRILRGMLLLCLAGLAVSAMILLPRV